MMIADRNDKSLVAEEKVRLEISGGRFLATYIDATYSKIRMESRWSNLQCIVLILLPHKAKSHEN